jgi:hypothetical protein
MGPSGLQRCGDFYFVDVAQGPVGLIGEFAARSRLMLCSFCVMALRG